MRMSCAATTRTAARALAAAARTEPWGGIAAARSSLHRSIQALLSAPNPDDPLAENVAKHWKENEAEAMNLAREWTRTHAQG